MVVISDLDHWVIFGATGCHSVQVAHLGASFQQLINSELPAPLLLRVPLVCSVTGWWVSETGGEAPGLGGGYAESARQNSFPSSSHHLPATAPHCIACLSARRCSASANCLWLGKPVLSVFHRSRNSPLFNNLTYFRVDLSSKELRIQMLQRLLSHSLHLLNFKTKYFVQIQAKFNCLKIKANMKCQLLGCWSFIERIDSK